ncbi:Fe-S-containing protein [Faecalimonas sp.]
MSNKLKKKSSSKMSKSKKYILPILTLSVLVICVAVVFLASKGSESNKKIGRDVEEADTINSGESLVIPVADVTTDATFFPAKVNGTTMEIIAVKDSEGNIRTAFNTCQICYTSGRGYYEQYGDNLVCQNCGNSFSMDQVEIETGGCNPWPIFDKNKTVTDDEILISYDFLTESQRIFKNWKTSF